MLAGYPFGTTETHILQGEDAYARLTAYVVIERAIDDSGPGYTLGAAIFPGEMPWRSAGECSSSPKQR